MGGIRWPILSYLHHNLESLINRLCILVTTLRTLNTWINQLYILNIWIFPVRDVGMDICKEYFLGVFPFFISMSFHCPIVDHLIKLWAQTWIAMIKILYIMSLFTTLSFLCGFHLLSSNENRWDPALKKLNQWDPAAARFEPSTSRSNTWQMRPQDDGALPFIFCLPFRCWFSNCTQNDVTSLCLSWTVGLKKPYFLLM